MSVAVLPSSTSTTERGQGVARRSRRQIAIWFAVFMTLSVLSWFYQQVDFQGSQDHGLPIPDVVNMTSSIDNIWTAFGRIDDEGNQFIGVSLIYGWTWLVHPSLCFVVNIVLMAWATSIYSRVFVRRLGIPGWSVVGFLGNPYLMLAMVGPNKEIPLAVLTILYFKTIVERRATWPFAAMVIGAFAYLFRDGYGAFLMGSTILFLGFRLRARPYAFAICLGCLALATLFGLLETVIPLLNRNVESFEAANADNLAVGALAAVLGFDPFSPIGGFLSFGVRLIYNLFSAALFPVFRTTGGVYWIGLGYWINGLMALVCIPACALSLFRKGAPVAGTLGSAISVATLFMISVSLFVQPRYLMPILPLAMAAFASSPRSIRQRCMWLALALCALISLTYWLLDREPPLADPDSFPTPAYILGT